jgi:hypothetical protein
VTPERAVVHRFVRRLETSIDYHRELLLAVHMKRRQASLESMLVEQFVFYVGVLWELFINDLLLRYLTLSPDTYFQTLEQRIEQSLKDRYGPEAARCTEFSRPTSVSLHRAASFVDPKGFNLSARSADILTKRANELLAAPYAKKFTLEPDDAQFVDFLLAVRNYLGHRSKGARAALKAALTSLTGPNASFNAPFRDVPSYLKTRVGPEPRSVLIASRLIDVANKLA